MGSGTRTSLESTPFEDRTDRFYRLWAVATITYGVGDVVTTVALLRFDPSVGEANPLLRTAVEAFGLAGLVGLKLAVFFCCLGVQVYAMDDTDDPIAVYAPPAVLALFGAFTTAFNLRLLIG